MTPAMPERVLNYFVESGLASGFKTQKFVWNDTGSLADKFMVFRSNGGSGISQDLGAEYLVLVDVIGAKNGNQAVDDAVQAIIEKVKSAPMPNDCIGHIENFGGIPSPVLTTEGRLVYRLQFACLYGE